ncbi:hypothetical protein HYT45_02790 [Candidatus Uhrbacteria bacterium]|nr:hypothetical protein [Candidatus Uhrbacteria bacterium]
MVEQWPAVEPETKEDITRIIAETEKLISGAMDDEKKRELTERLAKDIANYFEKQGATEHKEWEQKLRQIVSENKSLIVRKEYPKTVFDLAKNKDRLKIKFSETAHGGEEYPNAAIMGGDLAGLRTPFTRGFGKVETGAVVMIIGFAPGEHLSVKQLPRDRYLHYRGRERSNVRMVEGDVPFEDIKFIMLRLPRRLVPEPMMTDDELDSETPYISRLFTFEKEEKIRAAA